MSRGVAPWRQLNYVRLADDSDIEHRFIVRGQSRGLNLLCVRTADLQDVEDLLRIQVRGEELNRGDACRPLSCRSTQSYLPGPKNGAKNVSGMPLRPSAQIGKTRFAPDVPPM